MLFDGMLALAGTVAPAVRLRVRDQGWFPFVHVPAVGVREESAASPPPTPVKFLLAHHPGPVVPQASHLGCPVLCWAALYCCCMGVRVPPLLVSVLLRRWRSCRGSH